MLNGTLGNATSAARRGFTLLELLVVAAVIGILGSITTSIFISINRAYNKANVIAEIEQNGNLAIATMSNEIRNALSVSSSSTSELTITNQEGATITFEFVAPTANDNGYIQRTVEAGSPYPITDNQQGTGVNVADCEFTIDPNADPPVVGIEIDLEQPKGVPGRIDFRAGTTLTTTVSLRTYK